MSAIARLTIGGVALAVGLTWWSPLGAQDCGDTAGDGGARVPCACGGSVVTDTTLQATDPVVGDGPCSLIGLNVSRPSVTLDCAGLSIEGPGNTVENSVGVLVSNSQVSVLRCVARAFQYGINAADGVGGLLIQANTLTDNEKGFRGGEPFLNSRLIGNTASNNIKFGIQLKNGPVRNVIQGNTTMNNGRTGIQLNREAKNNQIILNYVTGDGSRGGIRIDSSSTGNLIEDNFVNGGVFGVGFNAETNGNLVRRNIITGTTLAGIWFNGPGTRNTARENLITTNQGEGIRLEGQADDHTIDDNLVFDNARGGIEVCGADAGLTGNKAFNNVGFDYCIAADRGNRSRNNEGAVFDLACPVPPQCRNLREEADSDGAD